ncbi:Hypothetical protein CINCED_3A015700 [Cinara cedri]|uniref:Uncharacterized protein n=1 Tax=Cinara cedri TaxID=506608 RepID=A0A5E4N0C7_9HEMI|nr:Hypothetical protein CINCED_3A015700 [Cinara cedri]
MSSTEDIISFDIANTQLKITSTKYISIKDIWAQIRPLYDIENIFWYPDSVIIAIVILIFHEILNVFIQTNSFLWRSNISFEFLCKWAYNLNHNAITEIKEFDDKMEDIELFQFVTVNKVIDEDEDDNEF